MGTNDDGPLIKGRFLKWLHTRQDAVLGMDPGAFDPDAVRRTLAHARRFFGAGKYFGLRANGLDTVPPAPVMVVSNHSGGTTIPDVWGFMVAWYGHFGVERPLHPLAHDVIMSTPTTGTFFERRGVLRANSGVAVNALLHFRRDVLVMPGGDLDTWRPYKDRFKVRFNARAGYVRTALRARVDIVPVANAGAHETLYVLTDGRRIAKAIGLQALARAEVFPIHFSLPWGLAFGPLPHLPWPTELRYRVAPVIPLPRLDESEVPDESLVRDIDATVRAAIQSLLDQLRDETPLSRRDRARA